ncbi:MAG: hypothetical protein E7487_11525, partial [Ruminococcaceae bacterium]|nr:hypothetical protein [Oscillospiraceae bacterium]
MKKILALLLALMMIVTVFAGCADTTTDESKAEDKSSAADDKKDDAADDEKPADDGEIPELVVLVGDGNVPEYPLNMERPTMQKIHDELLAKFNVDWKIESVINEKFEETVNTRLAAGTDLPDMIKHRFGDSRLLEIYNNGLIIGLNDLIEEYGPNV